VTTLIAFATRRAAPIALVAALLLGFDSLTSAQQLDAGAIADGLRLFRQKGNCQACHGWAGDGRKMDSQMPDGANLRESAMNRNGNARF
jgi:mono/diheme cytochrome c family protein